MSLFRARRDARPPNFSKLTWMARRRGPKGRAALQVLQDALMEYYPKQWARAVEAAERREGEEKPYVFFWPEMERRVREGKTSGPMEPFSIRYQPPPSGKPVYQLSVAVYKPGENLRVRRIKRVLRRRPPGPSRFGQERTRKDILARIRWERWAAASARHRGQVAIATGHEIARVKYKDLLKSRKRTRP